jgi:hypothetical protein
MPYIVRPLEIKFDEVAADESQLWSCRDVVKESAENAEAIDLRIQALRGDNWERPATATVCLDCAKIARRIAGVSEFSHKTFQTLQL